MQSSQTRVTDARRRNTDGRFHLVVGAAGLLGLIITFVLSTSQIDDALKIAAFLTVAIGYMLVFGASFFLQHKAGRREMPTIEGDSAEGVFGEIESKLIALDETNKFFGTSLEPADMFRLVSHRVAEIFPFAASALFIVDESETSLKISRAEGKNAPALQDCEIGITEGLAGRSVGSRAIEIDENTLSDTRFMPDGSLEGFHSAIAIPLMQDKEVFGVLQLYLDHKMVVDENTLAVLEAIRDRIEPLFLRSKAYELSVSSALTDKLTGLPNERAFFMILENQLAESHRYRDDRPLTVLAIDIKDFADANSNFGHAMGDRLLTFVARHVGEHLRKMDFLARSISDEFLVILPTAAEKTALDIVERIRTGFANNPFEISQDESVKIWLNFGWATFWQDGDTARQLLQNAQLRKQQEKSAEPPSVLWFPKEYMN